MAHSLATHLHLLPGSGSGRIPAAASTEPLDDAFRTLAPGEQRIARVLYDAQMAGGDSGASWPQPGARLRSLDEIAEMHRSGAGWSQVFKQLKADGLIAEQTLGHVVARRTRYAGSAEISTPRLAAELRAAPSPVPSRTG